MDSSHALTRPPAVSFSFEWVVGCGRSLIFYREHMQGNHPDHDNFGSHNGGTPEERDQDVRESELFVLRTHQELVRMVREELPPNSAFTLPAFARYDISVFDANNTVSYFVNEVEWSPRMALWYYERANIDEFLAITDAFAASIWDMCAGTPESREEWVDSLLSIDINSRYK